MRMLRLPTVPETPPRFWPRFSSPLHSPAITARVGRVLGIAIGVCFVTGLLSHYQYQPWHWLPEPASPAWGYRLTQGLHVIVGIACIPLLLVKLWTVYPKLFAWPPAKSLLDGLERLSIAVLVSATLLELTTGFLNILRWYAWPWGFVDVHYALAFVIAGSLLLHIAVKLPIIRQGLATKLDDRPATDPTSETARRGISRRGLLIAAGGGVGAVVLTTVGQTFSPLEPIAILAPRRPSKAPLRVPVNRTARDAQVTKLAVADSYRLACPRGGVVRCCSIWSGGPAVTTIPRSSWTRWRSTRCSAARRCAVRSCRRRSWRPTSTAIASPSTTAIRCV